MKFTYLPWGVLIERVYHNISIAFPVFHSAFSAFFFACPFVDSDDGGALSTPKTRAATTSIQHPPTV